MGWIREAEAEATLLIEMVRPPEDYLICPIGMSSRVRLKTRWGRS